MTGPSARRWVRAREHVVTPDDSTTVVAEAEMHLVIDFAAGMLVGEITMEPAVDGLDAHSSVRTPAVSCGSSFDLETGTERGFLPYLLLDDVPGATLRVGLRREHGHDRG